MNPYSDLNSKYINQKLNHLTGTAHNTFLIGCLYALKKRYDEIYQMRSESLGQFYDFSFNFKHLMLLDKMLAPVLQKISNKKRNKNDANVIQIGTEFFKIKRPAIEVSTCPTWQNCLKQIVVPNGTISKFGTTDDWEAIFYTGYLLGEKLAVDIWSYNLKKLTDDCEGMRLFMNLLRNDKITTEMLADKRFGAIMNENCEAIQRMYNYRYIRQQLQLSASALIDVEVVNSSTLQTDKSDETKERVWTFKIPEGVMRGEWEIE